MEKKVIEHAPVAFPYNDYVQSANTLFHFMSKSEHLEWILKNRAIAPRYCVEDMAYLNIVTEDISFQKIAVLQKCFCDIPFHKLTDTFELDIVGDSAEMLSDAEKLDLAKRNTHPDCYGKYAIAFSKKWGENHHLQPVQYINTDSAYATEFSKLFSSLWSAEQLPNDYADDILNRLSFMKPLRGTMSRSYNRTHGETIWVELQKNFHDEREWRYVPNIKAVTATQIERVIANPYIIPLIEEINKTLMTQNYQRLWLEYDYDEIRYIIVPDAQGRLDFIDTILQIPDCHFSCKDNAIRSKYVLISKILVLDEIKKDW